MTSFLYITSRLKHFNTNIQQNKEGINKVRHQVKQVLETFQKSPNEQRTGLKYTEELKIKAQEIQETGRQIAMNYQLAGMAVNHFHVKTKFSSRVGLFLSFVPFTAEFKARREAGRAMTKVEQGFKKLTKLTQQFTNMEDNIVNPKAKLTLK